MPTQTSNSVDQPAHGTERGDSFVQFAGFAVSVDGEAEDGFGVGAGEDGVGAGTRVGGNEIKEDAEVVEAVGES